MGKKKEFKFKCKEKPYLYVGVVGAQFINGKFKTTDKKVAQYLQDMKIVDEL